MNFRKIINWIPGRNENVQTATQAIEIQRYGYRIAEFPILAVEGKAFTGYDHGEEYLGVISRVVRSEHYIRFMDKNDREAFGFRQGFGSWMYENGELAVHTTYNGTWYIHDVLFTPS